MTNAIKTYFLIALLIGLTLLAGQAIGGEQGLLIAMFFSFGMSFISYWFSDSIVLSMYGAQEVTKFEFPELHRVVEELSVNAGIPKPAIYLIPSDSPNAFATGRGPGNSAVAVTSGILKLLSPRELRGVIAHEITHIANYDVLLSTIVAIIAGSLSILSRMVFWGGFGAGEGSDGEGHGNPLVSLVLMMFAPFIAFLIQMSISRNREFMADEGGAKLTGDPDALASALIRLHSGVSIRPMHEVDPATSHMFIMQPFNGSDFAELFSTHPPVEERVFRLRSLAGEERFSGGNLHKSFSGLSW